jgi:hypothetical protein
MASVVYALCLALSVACALLLWRGYRKNGARLLLWSSLCFMGLATNNLLLIVDLVLFTNVDLAVWRNLSATVALAALVYGLIWEAE